MIGNRVGYMEKKKKKKWGEGSVMGVEEAYHFLFLLTPHPLP